MTPIAHPVVDLHADLPYYLTHRAGRTPRDATSRCSVAQLRAGGVAVQVLTIFVTDFKAERADGPERAMAQARAIALLSERYPEDFVRLSASRARGLALDHELADLGSDTGSDGDRSDRPIGVLAAVENAAGLAAAEAPLEDAFRQLDALQRKAGPLLYVGLTWRGENRFGGGDATDVGLKDDGRKLLERLAATKGGSCHTPAVDLSHASDALAEETLAFIGRETLPLVVIASHSNFRAVRNHRRNLPDWLAGEIAARGGIIGLNLCRTFVGDEVSALAEHVAHGIALGLGGQMALGTDFFWEGDLPAAQRAKQPPNPFRFYFPDFADASCHQPLQRLLRERSALSDAQLAGLTHANAAAFLRRLWSP